MSLDTGHTMVAKMTCSLSRGPSPVSLALGDKHIQTISIAVARGAKGKASSSLNLKRNVPVRVREQYLELCGFPVKLDPRELFDRRKPQSISSDECPEEVAERNHLWLGLSYSRIVSEFESLQVDAHVLMVERVQNELYLVPHLARVLLDD